MFERNKGADILSELGGIRDEASARELLGQKMPADELFKLEQVRREDIFVKIANAVALCLPETVFVNTGTAADRRFIRDLALKTGEEKSLSMPDHTIHFDLKEEQGRIIDRTFYIANPGDKINSLALSIDRNEAIIDIRTKMSRIMADMTMIIGFYVRGPVGAPVSNPAIEITSSAYVAHSAEILYCNAYSYFLREVVNTGHFFTNLHSQGLSRPEDLPNARVYMDRSHHMTYSINCTYAGNTLLMKKGNHRFAVDKAVYENTGNELSEHMFITGFTDPDGETSFFAGAAPSGCGKTTTAMAGDHFVGDDLAQMWIADDGSVRGINPECGIFGILQDVNWKGDPNIMKCLRNPGTEVIWSNVLIDENQTPQWTGNGEPIPESGVNFQGKWKKGMTDENGEPIPMSHPNSRCMFSFTSLANYSREAKNPEGVEIRVITYSGRDSDTMPPVWATTEPDRGIAIGACIVSAATAAEVGATGVKRSPWANAPFIPGPLGDYMNAQFKFFNNPRIHPSKRPVLAGLNYFLTDRARGGDTNRLLGEKKDVRVWLTWLEQLARGKTKGIGTPIGLIPTYPVLKNLFNALINKDYPESLYIKQFSLYVDNIVNRLELQQKAYRREENIPDRFFEILEEERNELVLLKENFGSVVSPDQILNDNSASGQTCSLDQKDACMS